MKNIYLKLVKFTCKWIIFIMTCISMCIDNPELQLCLSLFMRLWNNRKSICRLFLLLRQLYRAQKNMNCF